MATKPDEGGIIAHPVEHSIIASALYIFSNQDLHFHWNSRVFYLANHTSEWFLQRWLRRKEEHEGAPIVMCAIIPPSLELATPSPENDCNAVLGF